MEGGMRGKGQGKSSTDCLSIAADGVPKPTTGANIIASNIIHYRCQRCLPAGCLRPALSTLDYTPPLPPCFPYCTSSLHSVSGQQFAPMLQVGDIATDTSRSLARCLKLCSVSSYLLLCRSLLKKKSMKLQGDIPCPPPSTPSLWPAAAFAGFEPHESQTQDKVLRCKIKTKQATGKALPAASQSQSLPLLLPQSTLTLTSQSSAGTKTSVSTCSPAIAAACCDILPAKDLPQLVVPLAGEQSAIYRLQAQLNRAEPDRRSRYKLKMPYQILTFWPMDCTH